MFIQMPDRLRQLGRPRVLVIGDLILDRYTWGDADRVSPEAPVLVLAADRREVRPGGAASVAALLRGLEVTTALAGVVGDDPEGRTLRQVLAEQDIDQELVLTDGERVTTAKERFLGRTSGRPPHQMLRVDSEVRRPLSQPMETALTAALQTRLADFHAVLIADYAKGCCSAELLSRVISAATKLQIPLLVDPGRGRDLALYRGATLLKPNRREAEALAGLEIATPEDGLQAARILCETADLAAAVITLDREGVVFATADGGSGQTPTRARSVFDITGAGDMALAALGLALAERWSIAEAVDLANRAAGLEIERLGIEPVTREELAASYAQPCRSGGQVCAPEELTAAVHRLRQEGRRIVFTNGCFDLLHAGHLQCLTEARALGDVLIVAINGDASVRNLKGPSRPVVPAQDRAALLASLACVDYVTIFEEATPHALLRRLRPDVLVKGGTTGEIVGREVVEAYGGQVARTGGLPDRSTTQLVDRMRRALVEPEPATGR